MRRWSEVAARIAATTRTTVKTATLAEYLRSLAPAELPLAVRYMTGRPFAEGDARTTGVGWAAIAGVAQDVVGARPGELSAAYNQSSDLGQAMYDLYTAHDYEPAGDPLTLPEVDAAFAAMAEARGPAAKGEALRALLIRCDPQSARSVVKILSGDLRIGLREGHLEAAIAGKSVSEVRQSLKEPLNIDPRALALVNGRDVAASYVLKQGDQLEFVRLAGEKGRLTLSSQRGGNHDEL